MGYTNITIQEVQLPQGEKELALAVLAEEIPPFPASKPRCNPSHAVAHSTQDELM